MYIIGYTHTKDLVKKRTSQIYMIIYTTEYLIKKREENTRDKYDCINNRRSYKEKDMKIILNRREKEFYKI